MTQLWLLVKGDGHEKRNIRRRGALFEWRPLVATAGETMQRVERELAGNCANCEGLCCVSLSFERGPAFSFEKAADVPCRHLLASDRCAVHAGRAAYGLAGCAGYECYGAGQRVARELFAGCSWRFLRGLRHTPAAPQRRLPLAR